MSVPSGAIARTVVFSLASNAAVLFVLKFGLFLWPERLPANSQNIFWLASGVNVAGLLILGLRYWPVLLLNAFPAWWFAGEPLDLTALGSLTNALEALLAAAVIRKWGAFAGHFESVRAVGALLAASVVAPLVNTLVIPAYFCAQGILAWSDYGKALANWNLANGAAILLLTPAFIAGWRGAWNFPGRMREGAAVAAVALGFSVIAFNGVFSGTAINYVFIVFPVVIYAAARFGAAEMSAILVIVMLAAYGSLATHARGLPPAEMSAAIWFVQAFCWVLAATGLLVAALGAERRRAEHHSLEISLREERARLEALRYQLTPHFLFNSLNSIYSTLPASGADVSRRMLTQLAGYLRSTLTGGTDGMIPLREELRAMENYLEVEKIRFGDDLNVTVTASEEARASTVPALLLQPLVENAIVHGFARTRGAFRLEISARVTTGRLHLDVANTGSWDAAAEGVGLTNTRRRLVLMFGDSATMEIEKPDSWVRIKIAMPMTSDQ